MAILEKVEDLESQKPQKDIKKDLMLEKALLRDKRTGEYYIMATIQSYGEPVLEFRTEVVKANEQGHVLSSRSLLTVPYITYESAKHGHRNLPKKLDPFRDFK